MQRVGVGHPAGDDEDRRHGHDSSAEKPPGFRDEAPAHSVGERHAGHAEKRIEPANADLAMAAQHAVLALSSKAIPAGWSWYAGASRSDQRR